MDNKLSPEKVLQLNAINATFLDVTKECGSPNSSVYDYAENVKVAINKWARAVHSILDIKGEVAKFEVLIKNNTLVFEPLNEQAGGILTAIETGFGSSGKQTFTDIIKQSMNDSFGNS